MHVTKAILIVLIKERGSCWAYVNLIMYIQYVCVCMCADLTQASVRGSDTSRGNLLHIHASRHM